MKKLLLLLTFISNFALADNCLKLLKANKNGNLKRAERLLKSGTKPDCSFYDIHSGTIVPMYAGSIDHNITYIDLLLKYGADINKVVDNNYHLRPIDLAVMNENDSTEFMQQLIDRGAMPDAATLFYAVEYLNIENIDFLLKREINPNDFIHWISGPAVNLAIKNKNFPLFKKLIAKEFRLNYSYDNKEYDLLSYASISCNFKVIDYILENHLEQLNNSILTKALDRVGQCPGSLGYIKKFVSLGAKVKDVSSPIYSSVKSNYLHLLTYYAQNGAPLDLTYAPIKNSILHVAAENFYDQLEKVLILIQYGANPNQQNIYGE